MNDPISGIFITKSSTALAQSARPHARVICEERPARRNRVRRRLMPRGR